MAAFSLEVRGDLFLAFFQLLKAPASLGLQPLPFKASNASPNLCPGPLAFSSSPDNARTTSPS